MTAMYMRNEHNVSLNFFNSSHTCMRMNDTYIYNQCDAWLICICIMRNIMFDADFRIFNSSHLTPPTNTHTQTFRIIFFSSKRQRLVSHLFEAHAEIFPPNFVCFHTHLIVSVCLCVFLCVCLRVCTLSASWCVCVCRRCQETRKQANRTPKPKAYPLN